MKKLKSLGVLVGLAVTRISLPVCAQDPDAGVAPPTRAEFNKLQSDVREQRQLMIQMMQTEQQRYDMLLRLIQGQGGGEPMAPAPAPPSAAEPTARSESAPAKRSRGGGAMEIERKTGAVEGRVTVAGGEAGDVYVYVENVKGPLVRNRSFEIRQEGKQFVPRVAVVQAGTTVVFPNFDAVYHNVFSNSPRNTFDLGTYRAGDKPRTIALASTGVVEVFCNIHQKMSAKILVVPNVLYTKVRADGTFRLENVPVGARRIVAWGPRTKSSQQRVDVTPSGAEVSFALERDDGNAHLNKQGQAYGSYRD